MKDAQRPTQLVAVVDDDDSVRSAVHLLLESIGMDARSFCSAEEFLDSGVEGEADCLITDLNMPGMGGLNLQAHLLNRGCRLPVIVMTAYGDARSRLQALNAGARGFLEKPFDHAVLIEAVREAIRSL